MGTSLDEKLYPHLRLDYALLSAPGAPLKKALIDAGIGKDIPVLLTVEFISRYFPLTTKNANVEQKEAFISTIEDTLRKIAEEGIDKRHSGQELIIMNSVSGRQISEVIRGD